MPITDAGCSTAMICALHLGIELKIFFYKGMICLTKAKRMV
jgi:hypothetical protein